MLDLTATLTSPILGRMIRKPVPTRVTVGDGTKTVLAMDAYPSSLGLDEGLVQNDWFDQPWFLQPLPDEMERFLFACGFDVEKRRTAARALHVLFPHDVCLDMAREERRLALIYGLYEPYVLTLLPLLPLGLDLDTCQPWHHERLIKEFKRPRTHWAAQREWRRSSRSAAFRSRRARSFWDEGVGGQPGVMAGRGGERLGYSIS